jgi:hypothetical protein
MRLEELFLGRKSLGQSWKGEKKAVGGELGKSIAGRGKSMKGAEEQKHNAFLSQPLPIPSTNMLGFGPLYHMAFTVPWPFFSVPWLNIVRNAD